MKTERTEAIQIISDVFSVQLSNGSGLIDTADKYLLLYFAHKINYTGDAFSGDQLHKQFYNFLKKLQNKGVLFWVIQKEQNEVWEPFRSYSSLDYIQEEVLSDLAELRYEGGNYRIVKAWVPLKQATSQ